MGRPVAARVRAGGRGGPHGLVVFPIDDGRKHQPLARVLRRALSRPIVLSHILSSSRFSHILSVVAQGVVVDQR